MPLLISVLLIAVAVVLLLSALVVKSGLVFFAAAFTSAVAVYLIWKRNNQLRTAPVASLIPAKGTIPNQAAPKWDAPID